MSLNAMTSLRFAEFGCRRCCESNESRLVFRVRMHNLKPETTYYYEVYSEQANGISDPAVSAVNQFTTRSAKRMSANK